MTVRLARLHQLARAPKSLPELAKACKSWQVLSGKSGPWPVPAQSSSATYIVATTEGMTRAEQARSCDAGGIPSSSPVWSTEYHTHYYVVVVVEVRSSYHQGGGLEAWLVYCKHAGNLQEHMDISRLLPSQCVAQLLPCGYQG